MRLLAVDPGSEESGLVVYDTDVATPTLWEKTSNENARHLVAAGVDPRCRWAADRLIVEMPVPRGMPASKELFETCVQIGRFIETWRGTFEYVDRAAVKLHLCHNARAKDSNVRQALIDRYGGREKAIGKKATPGPLYGIKADCWSALAVAITAAER